MDGPVAGAGRLPAADRRGADYPGGGEPAAQARLLPGHAGRADVAGRQGHRGGAAGDRQGARGLQWGPAGPDQASAEQQLQTASANLIMALKAKWESIP